MKFAWLLFYITINCFVTISPVHGAAVPDNIVPAVLDRTDVTRIADLPAMNKAHFIRVLTTYNKTNFFIESGRPRGFEYELIKEYEKFLNKNVTSKQFTTHVVFIPMAFEDLIPALEGGKGDIIAANLTITPERQDRINFTVPYLKNIDEIIVTSNKINELNTLDDLSGKMVYVLSESSFKQHLRKLNEEFKNVGKDPIKIVEASKNLGIEDILELVNAGIVAITVADSHIAHLWSNVLNDIILHPDLKINTGGRIAWAVRKNNPKLLAHLNSFLIGHKQGTLLGNIFFERYYENVKWIKNPVTSAERKKLLEYTKHFKKYAAMYGFDWRIIAAQAYQESKFDNNAVSPKGAVGVMQVKPSTAKNMGFENIKSVEDNIHAGVKYMAKLRENYFKDDAILPAAQLDFALAAYNAGPRRINILRKSASRMGLDKNIWFYNVERAALRNFGPEVVRYVGNINKYYIALALYTDILEAKTAEKKQIEEK